MVHLTNYPKFGRYAVIKFIYHWNFNFLLSQRYVLCYDNHFKIIALDYFFDNTLLSIIEALSICTEKSMQISHWREQHDCYLNWKELHMWEPGSYHIPAGPRLAKTVRLWSMKRVGRAFGRYCRFGRIFGSTDQNKKNKKKQKKKYIYIYFTCYKCRESAIS